MKIKPIWYIAYLTTYIISQVKSLCVLESDFGFSVNCNFKKSGMFRVRNLGGLKAHFGLGFSLGDELGFPESLGNIEGSKKRSLNVNNGENFNKNHDYLSMLNNAKVIQPHSPVSNVMGNSDFLKKSILKPHDNKNNKSPLMTEAMTLPLGVPRFKKLPQKNMKEEKKTFYYVPKFQSLPPSISNKFEEITKIDSYPQDNKEVADIDLKGYTIDELAILSNVSKNVILSAIKIRKQQMQMEKLKDEKASYNINLNATTTQEAQKTTQEAQKITQFSTTTPKSVDFKTKNTQVSSIKYLKINGDHKVMNAPKEYYPVAYDKNFDDDFKSKVDLPVTSFNCGDQKHFPGLYADQDLNCMVFHVCALTDDGLIMKSFLCPESTLFDQSILKCNWWFYADCKSSQRLYDSNLPLSKSYQLMKSLSFFSKNYKSSSDDGAKTIDNNKEIIL